MKVETKNVNGNEVGVFDIDLDGEADAIACDANHNGIIEDNEIITIDGEGIEMRPFAVTAGFIPEYEPNEMLQDC